MSQRPYCHLHCHTHYSLLDGASRVPELVQHVKSLGMNACAITDHGNLYGAIEFYRECKAGGINPIIGYEAYVAPAGRTDREAKKRGEAGYHLTLLAKNATGFKNLIKMASVAYLEGYYYVPRIDKQLLEAHREGIICLSGCASAEFSELILDEKMKEAEALAVYFHKLFGKDYHIEIQNNGLPIQKKCAQGAIEIANRLGLPLVATSDAHYLTQEDAAAHDVLLCINTGKTRDDAKRIRYGSDQFYVRGPEEMYRLFPEHAEAVKRSQEIADGVDIQLDFKKRHFPVFTPPEGKKPEDYLRETCEAGLNERFAGNPSPAARARLEHELGIICRMGFASYFLIVADFVRFAVEKGIPCSARGSACGSLVSYVLKLSHVDPLEYDLLFERFLDPNRSEAPDIDIDFCQERREEVIAYVKQKYGEGSVAQIATFGTLGAKAALRDVGRVLGLPLYRVDEVAKMVPTKLGTTLDDALEQNGDLKTLYNTDPQVHELIDIARSLEGTNRNSGTHAAGVVIANGLITDYVPVQRVVRKGEDGARAGEPVLTTQWVMGDVEKVGLLKMDFLGLRTLTLLENCIRLIRKTRGVEVDIYKLPIDDRETYELLQRGEAKGVFQFESDGIRELLKRLKPDNIRDIIACTALYRPGPLDGGMVDDYVDCKHGRAQPTYPHEIMKEVLEETYAVMCYQEQIMRILNRLGGIELASAYACIKAISKKKQDIIDARKADFVKGAQQRGVDEGRANELFGLIEKFAGYGFNKCLAGSTEVVDAEKGERTTLRSLYETRRPFTVHALGDDWKLRPRRVEDVIDNGVKPVYELRTAQGKRILATRNHPFRTLDGWTLLEDLRVGDLVAAQRVDARVPSLAVGLTGAAETAPKSAWLLGPASGDLNKAHAEAWRAVGARQALLDEPEPNSDITWDRIASITPRGEEQTFDLTVECDHNFVANGLIVHNSHSAAYAYVSYQTAYLKRHFTPEFMAALLTSEIDDGNKRDIMVEHIADARKLGVEVMGPDVNRSDTEFTVQGGKIVFGLAAIKGCGRNATDAIVRAREQGGPFRDIFDFCERVDHKSVNKASIERLIKAGSFDALGGHRAQFIQALPRAMQAAVERQADRRAGQLNMFELAGPAVIAGATSPKGETMPEVEPWSETEKLKNEKEVLDFYLSSHPLAMREKELGRYTSHAIGGLKGVPGDTEVRLGGMLTQVRIMSYKKPQRNGNTRYGRCKVEDFGGLIECVMWGDEFNKFKDIFKEDEIVIVHGKLERKTDEPLLVITRMLTLEEATQEMARELHVLFTTKRNTPLDVDRLASILKQTPGPCPVLLTIKDDAGRRCTIKLGREFNINPATYNRDELVAMLGSGSVSLR